MIQSKNPATEEVLKTFDEISSVEIENKVSLIDLAPTLYAFTGEERNSFFKGKNIFEKIYERDSEVIFHQSAFSSKENHLEIEDKKECNLAIQTENLKYILHYENGKEELYDLHLDPKEKNDISTLNKEDLAAMRRHAKEFEEKNPILNKA